MPPPLLVLLAIVSIQIGAALAVRLFPALGPAGIVFLRVGFSALMLLAVSRPSVRSVPARGLLLIAAYGALIGAMNLCFYEAIDRIPLGVAVTIEFTGPLCVAVFNTRRLLHGAWIALAVVGLAIMSPSIGHRLDPLGVMFALLAGCGWGGFVLLSARVGRAFERGVGLSLGMAAGALLLAPVFLASGAAWRLTPTLLLGGLAVALLATAIPFSLEFEALKRLPPRTYGVLVTLEPAVAMLVGMVVLGEAVSPGNVIAMVCVSVAALGMSLTDGR